MPSSGWRGCSGRRSGCSEGGWTPPAPRSTAARTVSRCCRSSGRSRGSGGTTGPSPPTSESAPYAIRTHCRSPAPGCGRRHGRKERGHRSLENREERGFPQPSFSSSSRSTREDRCRGGAHRRMSRIDQFSRLLTLVTGGPAGGGGSGLEQSVEGVLVPEGEVAGCGADAVEPRPVQDDRRLRRALFRWRETAPPKQVSPYPYSIACTVGYTVALFAPPLIQPRKCSSTCRANPVCPDRTKPKQTLSRTRGRTPTSPPIRAPTS